MWDRVDNHILMYDSIRNNYRQFHNQDIEKMPLYFRVYLQIERKEIDMLNKFYYAIMDYLSLGIEPNNYIQGTNNWKLIKSYLDEERKKSNGKIQ